MTQPKQGSVLPFLIAGAAVIGLIGFFFTWLVFMETITVEPGQQRVIVDKPYFFGHEGARSETLKDGRMLVWKTSTSYVVNMTPQSTHVSFDDFSSHDNILLDFETTIQFQYTDAVKLITKFGEQWFANNVARQYASIVREAVKKRTMSDMMSDPKTAAELDDEVTKGLEAHLKANDLPVRLIGVSLGRAKPNANVLAQMNETAGQQQREKTLIASTAAEAKRELEQIAKAKADNAYRNAMSLDPHMFLELEKIKRYSEACMKAGNTCIIDASGSGKTNVLVK